MYAHCNIFTTCEYHVVIYFIASQPCSYTQFSSLITQATLPDTTDRISAGCAARCFKCLTSCQTYHGLLNIEQKNPLIQNLNKHITFMCDLQKWSPATNQTFSQIVLFIMIENTCTFKILYSTCKKKKKCRLTSPYYDFECIKSSDCPT